MNYKKIAYKSMEFDGPVQTTSDIGKICGYASVFDVVDEHKDIIIRGSFGKLNPEKIKFLWQHDQTKPIGKITKIVEDYWGLYIEAEFALDVVKAQEAHSLVNTGAISGLSIGFQPKSYVYDADNNRIIDDIELWEVSLVTFPANKQANITDYKGFNQLLALRMLNNTLDNAMKLLEN